jgi:cytochrome c oxidase cbb3-type subunit I/II
LIPKLFNTSLYSKRLANTHFWIGTLGILFYALPMYWAGFTQALMWKQFRPEGLLLYPNFLETVIQLKPMYALRAFGGLLYLSGAIMMAVNVYKTVKKGSFIGDEAAEAPALEGKPAPSKAGENWHRWIERRPTQMLVGSLIVILIGGLVEIVPTILVKENIPTIASVQPYTPLELEGRDIYIREGCNNCHSQMIRPFRDEVARYGEYSKAGEFVYDHPFLWGSKRTGPDLHRVGNKYPDSWHYHHMLDPTSMSPRSLMPPYPWLFEDELNTKYTAKKVSVMRTLGVPYEEGYEERALDDLMAQARGVKANLEEDGIQVNENMEIVALIAYLQRLGTDISNPEITLTPSEGGGASSNK